MWVVWVSRRAHTAQLDVSRKTSRQRAAVRRDWKRSQSPQEAPYSSEQELLSRGYGYAGSPPTTQHELSGGRSAPKKRLQTGPSCNASPNKTPPHSPRNESIVDDASLTLLVGRAETGVPKVPSNSFRDSKGNTVWRTARLCALHARGDPHVMCLLHARGRNAQVVQGTHGWCTERHDALPQPAGSMGPEVIGIPP